ncbi:MAG: hypothetical protein ABR563_16970, partial [Pyrinomonadaceae bacterium]
MRLKQRNSKTLSLLMSFSMLCSLCGGIILCDPAAAQTARQGIAKPEAADATKAAALARYARNLTAAARPGELSGDTAGFARELRRTTGLLARDGGNPLIVDDAGAVKDRIVESLAVETARADAPESLRGKQVFSLDTGALLDGAQTVAEFESHLAEVLADAKNARGSVILFIDETTSLVGANAVHGANASHMIEEALKGGNLRVVGAASANEFDNFIAADATLKDLFQPVRIASSDNSADDDSDSSDSTATIVEKISPELQNLVRESGSTRDRVSVILQGGSD